MAEPEEAPQSKSSKYGRIVQTVSLPSGVKMRARRPSVLSLIASGGFPSELTLEIWKLASREGDISKNAESLDSLKSWAALLEAYIPYVLVTPQIGLVTDVKEDDQGVLIGTIVIGDLQDMDKQVLFLFGNGLVPSDEEIADGKKEVSAKSLASFRDGEQGADAGSSSEAVQPAPVVAGGDAPGPTPGA